MILSLEVLVVVISVSNDFLFTPQCCCRAHAPRTSLIGASGGAVGRGRRVKQEEGPRVKVCCKASG